MTPSEVCWWLCSCWVCRWWTGGRGKSAGGRFCRVGRRKITCCWIESSSSWRSWGVFNVCSKVLEMFYQSVGARVLSSTVVCSRSSISSDTRRLNKLIKKAGSVTGCRQEGFKAVVERRTLNKLVSIMDNTDRRLHHALDEQQSSFSKWLRYFHCYRNCYIKSFLRHIINLNNTSALRDS